MEKTRKNKSSFLAANIVSRRIALGFRSAEDFAEVAEIPYPTLRDIEAGYSMGRPATIQKIARAMNCTMDELYKGPKQSALEQSGISASIREIVDILTAFDEHEVMDLLELIRDRSRRRAQKPLKGKKSV